MTHDRGPAAPRGGAAGPRPRRVGSSSDVVGPPFIPTTPFAPTMGEVIASLVNFRDLGGLETTTGRRIAAGRVFRSDALTHLTDADRDHLRHQLGVRTVVDLRSPLEHDRLGRYDEAWLGVTVHELPILDGAVLREQASQGRLPMSEMYRIIAIESVETVRRAVGILADPAALPAVLACSGGKDRTGVVAALVLAALGVPREEILADYERSAPGLDALRERMKARMEGAGVVVPPDAFTLDVTALATVLDTVAHAPEAIDAYLGDDLARRLRRTLLAPAA